MISMLQTFSTADVQCRDRCGRSCMLQTFLHVVDLWCSNQMFSLATVKGCSTPNTLHHHEQPHIHNYACLCIQQWYSSSCHKCSAKRAALKVLFFLIKFKTLGLMVEPDCEHNKCQQWFLPGRFVTQELSLYPCECWLNVSTKIEEFIQTSCECMDSLVKLVRPSRAIATIYRVVRLIVLIHNINIYYSH